MDKRDAVTKTVAAFPGGVSALASILGMSEAQFNNRRYESNGQKFFSLDDIFAMQDITGTTHFAGYFAERSKGVFMKLPDVEASDRDDLLSKFTELQAKLGNLASKFAEATKDGEINKHEKASLDEIEHGIHKTLSELTALSYQIYCRPELAKLKAVK